MGYEEATAHLFGLGIDAMKKVAPTLERIRALLEVLDHPERAVPALHVTGTNGKTSTARIAGALLEATGLTVATYTSPHLESITERMSLNGEQISEEAFGEVFDHIHPYVELVEGRLGQQLTFFEILTGMFFLWAAEVPATALVVEVGLGGRWDATNVVESGACAITNIGLDHTQLLGGDRLEIAREKSGIIKPSIPVVTGERAPDVLAVIREEADELGAPVAAIDREFSLLDNRVALGGRYVSIKTSARGYDGLFLPLHGAHQAMNAAVALEAVTQFLPANPLDEEVVAEGFDRAVVPGRLETVTRDDLDAPIVLDVAHNPEGVSALIAALSEAFAFESVHFVVGILADKDFRGMLNELTRLPSRVTLTEPESVRAASRQELLAAAQEAGLEAASSESVESAVNRAIGSAVAGELICVTGSHYVVGQARSLLVRSRPSR